MSETAISLQHVSKRFKIALDHSTSLKYRAVHWRTAGRYNEFWALRDIDLHIDDGEFVGIVGQNGCGKSTLLKILSGIYRPTTGTARIKGRVSPFLELGVGFNPELTARENIYLNGAVLGLTHAQLHDRVDGILAFAGSQVEQRSDDKIKNFSSGMQVRLAFSVAIQADAQVLLMDEVLAVGDANFQDKCFDVFARYRREGKTVVLVTHDLASVETYCDRAVLLDAGTVVSDGRAGEVTARYRRRVGQQSDAERGVAESTDAAGGVVEEDDAGSWGTGEARITEVRFLDDEGEPQQTFVTGRPMTVVVGYHVHKDVGELTCGVSFHRADGFTVAGNNTYISGLRIQCPPPGSDGEIRYVVPELTLLRGTYRLTIALHDRHASYPYDHHDQAYEFRVVEESFRAGIVELGGHFDASGEVRRVDALRIGEVDGESASRQGGEDGTGSLAEPGQGRSPISSNA